MQPVHPLAQLTRLGVPEPHPVPGDQVGRVPRDLRSVDSAAEVLELRDRVGRDAAAPAEPKKVADGVEVAILQEASDREDDELELGRWQRLGSGFRPRAGGRGSRDSGASAAESRAGRPAGGVTGPLAGAVEPVTAVMIPTLHASIAEVVELADTPS